MKYMLFKHFERKSSCNLEDEGFCKIDVFFVDGADEKLYSNSMTNEKNRPDQRKKKRKLRSEAIVLLTLASLLLVIISAMGVSLLVTGSMPEIPGINMLDHSFHEKKEIIVIDPGHGGYDAGGEAQEVYEKDITLQVALYLGKELDQRGYTVIYTREKDIALGEYEFDDLSQRVLISEANHADAMLSLHTNIVETGYERVYGFEVYQNEANTTSKQLAEHTLRGLDDLHYSMNRGVKDGAIYQVISLNQTPAILIEMGFLNDEQDRAYLTSESGKKHIAKAIAEAVDQTFQ